MHKWINDTEEMVFVIIVSGTFAWKFVNYFHQACNAEGDL